MKLLSLAAAAALALVTATPASANINQIGNPQFLKPEVFKQTIVASLENQTWPGHHPGASALGYGFVLMKDTHVVVEHAYGIAEVGNGWGSIKPFTVDTPTDLGSSVKVMSTATLLKIFESRHRGLTLDQWLDQPMFPYLPMPWQNWVNQTEADNGPQTQYQLMRQVTFRQLFQHRSGWGTRPSGGTFGRIMQGVNVNGGVFNQRRYMNINMTILTYLLPRVLNPGVAELVEAQVAQCQISDIVCYGTAYGNFWESVMQTAVYSKAYGNGTPQPVVASCDPLVDYGPQNRTFARSFNTTNSNMWLTQSFWSEKANNGGCHAQGGYYMSLREWAYTMATIQSTNHIISAQTRARMYNDVTDPMARNQLGWSTVSTDSRIQQRFGVNGMPGHDGATDSYRTYVIQLPLGYLALIATNNGRAVTTGTLRTTLINAFVNATAHNF